MATKIQVDVNKQQAVSDLKEIQKGVEGVGNAAKKASEQVASVKPGGDAGPGDAMKAADELLSKLEAADAASGKAAESASVGWGKVGIAVAAVVGVIAAAKAAAEAFMGAVKTAAENGDADSQRLVTAIDGIGAAWTTTQRRVAEQPLFKGVMEGMTEFFKDLNTNISAIGHLGGVDEAIDKQIELNNARKQMGDVTKMLAEFDQQEREDRMRDDAKKLQTMEEVKQAIEEEREAILKRSTTEMADKKAIETAQAKLNALRLREKQIIKENEQAEKDAARDAKKAAEDAAKEKEKEAEIHERFQEKELEKRVQRIRDELAAELKAEAEFKAARLKMEAEFQKERQKILEAKGKDPGIQAAAAMVNQQAADPRAIAKRLSENAAEAAYMAASGGGQFELTPNDKKYIAEQRRQAYRDAMRQQQGQKVAGMGFTPEQIQGAIQQNAQAVLKNVGETKDVSAENLDATGMLVQEYQKNSAELQQMNAEVQLMKKQIGMTSQQNQRRRDQSRSNTY